MDANLFANVKILFTDFDGIHTDGSAYVSQDGVEMVRISRRDGLGIEFLRKAGIELCIVSKEQNPVVAARAKKLGAMCFQSIPDSRAKMEVIKKVIQEKGVSLDEIAYMGDDINDETCLREVPLSITVPEAPKNLRKIARYVTNAPGGQGAIREVSELILEAKGKPIVC